MIPISKPMIGQDEIDAAARVLKSGQLAQGPEVQKFEEEFAEYIGVDHAVAVSNGTTALMCALRAIVARDQVVHTTAFSFVSTATAIRFVGSVPEFHDIYLSDFLLPRVYSSSGYGRPNYSDDAVLLVHLYGAPCSCADQRDDSLPFIEDCAQAVGAEYEGKKVGSFGDAGCFSFYATKNMTSGGEGGMITTDLKHVADSCRLFRDHGSVGRYNHRIFGLNFRMTELQAAIGRVQLRSLDEWNHQRSCNAEYYDHNIVAPGITKQHIRPGCKSAYHQYVLRVGDDFPMTRDAFCSYLLQQGIGCSVHYPMPIPCQPIFGKCGHGEYPNAVKASRQVVSIPVGPWVTEEERRYIVDTINEVGENAES